MKSLWLGIWLVLSTAELSTGAILIEFNPQSQSALPGSDLFVDLNVSGLLSDTAPSLGVWDLDVGFNPTVLEFLSATPGDQLDLGFGSVFAVSPGIGDAMNLFEVSLASPADLDADQRDAFRLARLLFRATRAGSSPLTITLNQLGDSGGNPLFGVATPGSVVVTPEPSTLLLATPLLFFGLLSRRR
jgi:hypothetical protein